MTKCKIKEKIELGEYLTSKDMGDIVSAPFLLDRFDSEEDVCRWINVHGITEFRELMDKVAAYHIAQIKISSMMEDQRVLKSVYGFRF